MACEPRLPPWTFKSIHQFTDYANLGDVPATQRRSSLTRNLRQYSQHFLQSFGDLLKCEMFDFTASDQGNPLPPGNATQRLAMLNFKADTSRRIPQGTPQDDAERPHHMRVWQTADVQ